MQARLESSEFAYLLQTIEAKRVIGVSNAALFPTSETERGSLLAQGFAALQTHGWLVGEGNQFHMHNGLVRMVAITAVPDTVLLVTRYLPNNGQQLITYYRAQDWLVEQFLTDDAHYLLTELADTSEMIARLQAAFAIPTTPPWPMSITLDTAVFTQAVGQAQTGHMTTWETTLQNITGDFNATQILTHRFSGLERAGMLESAQLQGDELLARADIVLLRDREDGLWAMMSEGTTVSLIPLNQTQLIELVTGLLLRVQPH